MDQRLTFITLGVSDLEKSKAFYEKTLGWMPLKELEGTTFYKLNGIILSLFPSEELAKDAGVSGQGTGFRHFSLAHNVGSKEEVDTLFGELGKKGVTIIKPPEKVFWGGYSGYIADVDGHLWEIAFNPFLEMDGEGNVIGHE